MTVDTAFWRNNAACRSYDPDLWFRPSAAERAKEICNECPVREECGRTADAGGETVGVRAGFDLSVLAERKALHDLTGSTRQAPRPAPTKPCGKCGRQFNNRQLMRWCPYCRDMVEAAPVRAHVVALNRAGLTLLEVATLAGMTYSSLRHLMHGNRDQLVGYTSRVRAERIFAIPVPQAAAS